MVATMFLSQAQFIPGTRIAGIAICIAVLLSGCSSVGEPTTALSPSATTTATSLAPKNSALKTIDPQAFQAVVEAAAKQLKVPGAMVLLRTPQGNFNAGGRHHRTRRADTTRGEHSLPHRLEHQDHDWRR